MVARTARYLRKFDAPPLKLRISSTTPAITKNPERRSSQERRFQTSFRLARSGVIGLSIETILYPNGTRKAAEALEERKTGRTQERPACSNRSVTVAGRC